MTNAKGRNAKLRTELKIIFYCNIRLTVLQSIRHSRSTERKRRNLEMFNNEFLSLIQLVNTSSRLNFICLVSLCKSDRPILPILPIIQASPDRPAWTTGQRPFQKKRKIIDFLIGFSSSFSSFFLLTAFSRLRRRRRRRRRRFQLKGKKEDLLDFAIRIICRPVFRRKNCPRYFFFFFLYSFPLFPIPQFHFFEKKKENCAVKRKSQFGRSINFSLRGKNYNKKKEKGLTIFHRLFFVN